MLLGFISALLAVVYYQNDFTTRTSANGTGPGLAWSEFKYAKGQPLAHNFLDHNTAYRTICYNWQPSQDGWIKIPYGAAANDCLWTHVTDENDPCMIFSNTNETYYGYPCHTFRNVFSNGVVKMQFDLRAPFLRGSKTKYPWCWVRPLNYERATNPVNGSGYAATFPIEIGIAGNDLSGGWNVAGSNDGYRAYYSYGKTKAGHWYRHYVTLNLDTSKAAFEVYDLGESRIAMDATPTADPVVTKNDCIFRYANNGSAHGYLNGMTINVQQYDTLKVYGDDGFSSDYSYMIDNIKGSYQSSSGGSFVEFYRNDFTTSRRRTIDGSITSSHTFAYDDPVVVTNTHTIYSHLVSKVGRIGVETSPYLTGVFGEVVTEPKEPGADGWRFSGHTSFRAPVFVVPDANNNNMISCTSFGKNIQPMCEEITSGKIRFEFDQRMPKGWNGTQRCEIDLLSQAAWESSTEACSDGIIRFGCCGSAAGTEAEPNKQARAFFAGVDAVADRTYACDLGMKMSTWYRFRADVDLDAKTVTYYVYEIGASAPANPDDFVPGSGNLKGSRTYGLHQPQGYSNGIAAWAICNWNRTKNSSEGNDAAEYQTLIDNARLWKLKADGSLGDLIFRNNGYQTTRVFKKARKALWDNHLLIDRPEYAEDGIILTPTYYMPNYITGSDHAIQVSDVSYLGMTIPLGCTVRSGILRAQYDVRLANNTDYGDTCKVYLGGAQLGSASELGTGYSQRFNTGYAIGTGVCNKDKDNKAANGVRSCFYCVYEVGNRAGTVTRIPSTLINSDGLTEGKWVRVKIVADVDAKKYDVSFYDMGSTHPSFDTPDGTLIFSNGDDEVPFKWTTDPISHMYIFGGHTPSYAPWLEDAPGACLIDNIRVSRDDRGLVIILN